MHFLQKKCNLSYKIYKLKELKVIKTYKYKLNPNKVQQATFDSWVGINRYLYNIALEHRITAYKSNKTSISKFEQYNQLTEAKKDVELFFLKRVHSQVLQETLDRVDKAYRNFFKGSGFPQFQKKGSYNSFTFKQGVRIEGNKVRLPKIGFVKFFNSRTFEGKIKTVTVIKELDKWYVCFAVETSPIIYINSQDVGIDMGITKLATLSDGTVIENPKFLNGLKNKIRILSRKLARQKKGSNSREKTKCKLAKTYQKLRRCRTDYLHKATTNITNKYGIIYVEDLKIKNMSKSSKGTAESPGKNVKAKSGLNRSLLDVSIGIFFSQLEYKTKFKGGHLEKVNPAYTSQKCSVCEYTSKKNRKTQSCFDCQSCGHKENADLNAAKNILGSGRTKSTQRRALAHACT